MTDADDLDSPSPRPKKQRSIVDVLHVSAFMLITITGLGLIGSAALVVSYTDNNGFGLGLDFWESIVVSLPRFETLLPALFGLIVLALLRHLGKTNETPGFFVALGVAGLSGVVIALSSAFGMVRLATDTLNSGAFALEQTNKVVYYAEWAATTTIGLLGVYLAWSLWSDESDAAMIEEGSFDSDVEIEDEDVDGENHRQDDRQDEQKESST